MASSHVNILITAFARQDNFTLHNAALAVVSLDAGRRSPYFSGLQRKAANVTALKAYHQSLTSLRKRIEKHHVFDNDALIWSTFFLGIFEVRSVRLDNISY